MAKVFPFQGLRYTSAAGPLGSLVTQPYDKIYPPMKERYLAASPYNLVRIILGGHLPSDSETDNAYTRAAGYLREWSASGILKQDPSPSFYAYFQEFRDPDTKEQLIRKGLIGLGQVEDYSAKVVHRHEQTLSGPKKDRLELLRHTKAHFGQIFMLYPDPTQAVDRILDHHAATPPENTVTDEYQAVHRLWPITDPVSITEIQRLMADKKLVIADGHHRYETALSYSRESSLVDAQRVMMTFVNMNSPGLRILATHRLVNNLASFSLAPLLDRVGRFASVERVSFEQTKPVLTRPDPGVIRLGIAVPGESDLYLVSHKRTPGDLDVRFLHDRILGDSLGISEEAVREEKYLGYVRGMDAAVAEVRAGRAQVAFLLQPTTVQQVANVSFGGGVMPQKSTDFYPKLLSGLTIYKLER